MADSPQNDSRKRQNVSPDVFARFLEFLSPDTEEAGRLYTTLHKKLVGFFSLKGISDPVSAADETIDRAAIKMNAGTPISDVSKYCSGIARNIVKEKFRLMQRESSAFNRFVESLSDPSDQQVERIQYILKPCFDQLTTEEQKLLLDYCQIIRGHARAEHRRHLAVTMNTTVLALRMRVTRLRSILTDCVEKRLNNGQNQL
jgi:hypothetical protein